MSESGTERPATLELLCRDCDELSRTHRRDGDQWVCTGCGNIKKCSNPQWSDNCVGDLITVHEVKKGLCEGCIAVIDSWSDDGDSDEKFKQTKLMTDGGTDTSVIEQSTLDGHRRTHPTCEPPHHPELTCENHVDRVITVYYGCPAMTEIDWWVCDEHADEVRETGEVRADREYSEARDGYGVVQR